MASTIQSPLMSNALSPQSSRSGTFSPPLSSYQSNSHTNTSFEPQSGLRHSPRMGRPSSGTGRPSSAGNTVIDRIMRETASPTSETVNVNAQFEELKQEIMLHGLSADETGMSHHRIYIWLLLLNNVTPLSYDTYAAYLERGASPAYSKIKNDVHRTLATDPLFARRVSQNSISRLLNAMAWRIHDFHSESTYHSHTHPQGMFVDGHDSSSIIHKPSLYVQGMNVLAAPLLYVSRSEPQAFVMLQSLLLSHVPSYITPSMDGVHLGLALLDKLLARLDPHLSQALLSKNINATTWAFPSISTLSACTPPLPEVLVLWDFLLAWGVHLNVLAVAAQVILLREEIMSSTSPGMVLRSLGPLKGRQVVEMTISFVSRVDEETWTELVKHTFV